MSEPSKSNSDSKRADSARVIDDFVNGLSDEARMLIVLRSQLYENSWEPMLDDLRNRLVGKPYIFKLANRIQDDIARIERLSEFENEHSINLADYIDFS